MRSWTLVRAAAISLLLLACQLVPDSLTNRDITIVSGNNQTGSPGALLPSGLKVRAVDDKGRGVKNVKLTFQVASGGGRVQSGGTTTDQNGEAEDHWTLGMSGTQRVEVHGVQGPAAASE